MKNYIPDELKEAWETSEVKFRDTAALVDMVVQGEVPSFILCGDPGIGKTHVVLSRLETSCLLEDFNYKLVKGYATAKGLYEMLWDNRNKAIVLDDTDSVLKDRTGINILKGALDSYDRRIVSWHSDSVKRDGIPKDFEFDGSIIFISNIDARDMDAAILSRSLYYNLVLTPEETIARMYGLSGDILKKYPMDDKLDVLGLMRKKMASLVVRRKLNLRTMITGIKMRKRFPKKWQKMILEYA